MKSAKVTMSPLLPQAGSSTDILNFIAAISRDAAENPGSSLSRLMQSQGYELTGTGSDGDSAMFGTSGSFSLASGESNAFFAEGSRHSFTQFVSDMVFLGSRKNAAVEDSEGEEAVDDEAMKGKVAPWKGECAVMFLDLSGYSKITSALLSSGGAHALSAAVNAYFDAILEIVVRRFNGDVLKFAGDAIVIAWHASADTAKNCLASVACALELQKKCGMYPVAGTDLFFRLHIGITCGVVESEVFDCAASENMQSAYHFVSGAPFTSIGVVVDAAASGEVCVSKGVADLCGDYLQVNYDGRPKEVCLVSALEETYNDGWDENELWSSHVDRDANHERSLVPPQIARKLRQGFRPSHIAEMRFLCVLFIHKVVKEISVGDWFSEVHQILDSKRCPIVQIIDDDKGTHVIAAVNLYVSSGAPSTAGLAAARLLMDRRVGCVVGMACGSVFCGITGSDDACRWDITGPACVRACRLMQHAEKEGWDNAMDESVYNDAVNVSQLIMGDAGISLKGSPDPVPVFRLSSAVNTVTSSIVSPRWMAKKLHEKARETLRTELINCPKKRAGALVTGPPRVGKKSLALSLIDGTSIIPCLHTMTRGASVLVILRTLAQWFTYHADDDVRSVATELFDAWSQGHMTNSLVLGLKLVRVTIEKGLQTCFIVQHAHFLCPQSSSFLHESLKCSESERCAEGAGRWIVFLTSQCLYDSPPPAVIRANIRRNQCVHLPHVELSASPLEGFDDMIQAEAFWRTTPQYAEAIHKKTSGIAGLIFPIFLTMRQKFVDNHKLELRGETVEHLTRPMGVGKIDITRAGTEFIAGLDWRVISPATATMLSEQYDVLPPRLQLVCRVLAAVAFEADGYTHIMCIFGVVQKLVKSYSLAKCEKDLGRLAELGIARLNDGHAAFCMDATRSTIHNLLTPDQDKLLKKHAARAITEYLESHLDTTPPTIDEPTRRKVLVYIASMWRTSGDKERFKKAQQTLVEAIKGIEDNRERVKAAYFARDELEGVSTEAEFGFVKESVCDTLNCVRWRVDKTVYDNTGVASLQFCKDYMPPMALGGYAGEVQKIAYSIVMSALTISQPGEVYMKEQSNLAAFRVDLDSLMKSLERFEKSVPQLDGEENKCTVTLDDERKWLEKLLTPTDTLAGCDALAIDMRRYHETVVMLRYKRVLAYVTPLKMSIRPSKLTKYVGAMIAAFERLIQEDLDNTSPAFHEALMMLATAGWKCPYMHLTLESVSNACLRDKTADVMDFKAMLFCFLLMGTHISGDTTLKYLAF